MKPSSGTHSANSEWSWKDTGQKISMGERVGKILKNLQITACMHSDERQIVSMILAFKHLVSKESESDPDTKEFLDFLMNEVKPAFEVIGHGHWYRDVITDLALAISQGKKTDDKTFKFDDELTEENTSAE